MDLYHAVLIIFIGTVAGFLNTVAGGGSLLTMPALIFLGLPSAVANGTNRVALMVQNIIAISNFRSKGYFDWKLSIMFALPSVLGSIVGSKIAISLPDDIFNKMLACVMVIVLALILWQPQKKIRLDDKILNIKDKIIGMVVFFFVGVYGGLIQAGVGFIIIGALTLITGFSLVKINSIKVFVVAVYMTSSLIIFIINGKVSWILGICLAVGNGMGAFLGSNFSVKKGDKWIKFILVISVFLMSAKLLGLLKF